MSAKIVLCVIRQFFVKLIDLMADKLALEPV